MMGLDPDELFEALCALARREGHASPLDRRSMVSAIHEALVEAQALVEGPASEPAAVFYAFGRRARSFRPVARFFIDMVVQAQAVACGYELEMSEVELAIFCARLALGQIALPDLRGWVADRLRPLGHSSRRPAPKRPL